MTIHLQDIPEEAVLELEGRLEMAGQTLDLPFPNSWEPVAYQLAVQRAGEECLVRGTLNTCLTRPCERCLEDYPLQLQPEFAHSYQCSDQQAIDLTTDLREDILLSLPLAFRCALDESMCCPLTGKCFQNEGPDEFEQVRNREVWQQLDDLKEN